MSVFLCVVWPQTYGHQGRDPRVNTHSNDPVGLQTQPCKVCLEVGTLRSHSSQGIPRSLGTTLTLALPQWLQEAWRAFFSSGWATLSLSFSYSKWNSWLDGDAPWASPGPAPRWPLQRHSVLCLLGCPIDTSLEWVCLPSPELSWCHMGTSLIVSREET